MLSPQVGTTQQTEILVIGAGAMGLAIAIALAQQGAQVTILSRDFRQAALHAAAGMLAPQAETLPLGSLRTLCLTSRASYSAWVAQLEQLTGRESGYWPCGILSPAYAADLDTPHSTPPEPGSFASQWLDRPTLQTQQPGLNPNLVGGWWYPQDGQVDNRVLADLLWFAAQKLGINVIEGVEVTGFYRTDAKITSLDSLATGQRIQGVATQQGDWQAERYVLATGAWGHDLLPIPVFPRKGQMFAVQGDPERHLRQVLFSSQVYLVPRRDGKILVGATVEDVGFTPHNTPGGLQQLLQAAIQLYPPIANLPILETWWGFRPATPDLAPLLGQGPAQNLFLATGHYRNGILLAPITAQLLAEQMLHGVTSPLLAAFSWQRFLPTAVA